jgi:hypothetical protein
MRIRQPSFPELVLQAIFLLLLVLHAADVVVATGAEACHAGGSADCYPWGAEGPTPWHYASKTTYLVTSAVSIAACGTGFLAPFLARGPRTGTMVPSVILLGLTAEMFWTLAFAT